MAMEFIPMLMGEGKVIQFPCGAMYIHDKTW